MTARGYYILGGVLAALGVLAVRVWAPHQAAGQGRTLVTLAGLALATIGLFVIALGFRQRIRARMLDGGHHKDGE